MRTIATALFLLGTTIPLGAQSFDVVSVKANHSDTPAKANFPLGPGDVYVTNGGFFTASNFPLSTYIYFAYKIMGNDMQAVAAQLPGWVLSETFDIQARTDGDPAKDKKDTMRLMMRALLADRFKLATHYETRQVSVFGLGLVKPGKLGPPFQAHPADAACTTVLAPNAGGPAIAPTDTADSRFPSQCGGLLLMPATTPGRIRGGARNVTMQFIANQLSAMGQLGRPTVDQTGLTGTFDFAIEFVPDRNGPLPLGQDFQPDPNGPNFAQAVKEQLGLKLDSQKAPSEFLVIDHVERPSEN